MLILLTGMAGTLATFVPLTGLGASGVNVAAPAPELESPIDTSAEPLTEAPMELVGKMGIEMLMGDSTISS